MKNLKKLTLTAVALTAFALTASAAEAPIFFQPDYKEAGVLHSLSNNGKYGVSCIMPDEAGFSYTVGAVFYDLSGDKIIPTNITLGKSQVGAYDVTDDGKLVVGSADTQPAICRNVNGTWQWENLPVPNESITMIPETADDGIPRIHTLNGGDALAVTPDGKYAVGLVRCNEYELYEKAVMWDLTTKSIIELKTPEKGNDGVDYHQTRYIQLSADGRYILGWNAFSWSGSLIYVFDRQTGKTQYIGMQQQPDGTFKMRVDGYDSIEMDGNSKAMTSDGRYITGAITKGDNYYIFKYDVLNDKFDIFNDGINEDCAAWNITKSGIVLAASPANNPYADAFVLYDNYLFPVSKLYSDVYGIDTERLYGIDNTGKPTHVSDDGRTIVFVTGKTASYALRMKEDLSDALDRMNLMTGWSAYPAPGTTMTAISKVTLTFGNHIEADASKASSIKLTDSKGNTVANPLSNGGLLANGKQLSVVFRSRDLTEGETYTLTIPEGVCWVKGRPTNTNQEIKINYIGRGDHAVKVKNINPASGTQMSNLDVNENPVVVTFDVPVIINGTADNRPIAHLFADGADEPLASINLDVDLNTGTLVIYPAVTVYLYKGSNYVIKVPAGAVTDISGRGASEAFEISYTGSYIPQIGDELYVFKSNSNSFDNFLFYEGDHGEPTDDYASLGFKTDSTPWWVVAEDEESTDMAFASHSSYVDGRQANDWLAIRQLKLPTDVDTYLSFKSQSHRKNRTDILKVYVYEENTVLNQLTSSRVADILKKGDLVFEEVLSPGANEEIMVGEWTDNAIPLTKYAGKSVYICFLNDNKNQSMIMLDDICVVKEVKAFVTITSPQSVVNVTEAQIKGILSINSEVADYTSLAMKLLDGQGNEISSISADGLSLKYGDLYNFEFPQSLPVTVGVENPYSIEYTLDDETVTFSSVVRDLAFAPEKRVVIEEYTGKTCQYCPLGIVAMERLESLYGSRLIPVILHAYSGDPKGANIYDYADNVFGTSPRAPSARINRRAEASDPMITDANGKYTMSSGAQSDGSSNLWQDVLVAEFNEPTFLDVALKANDIQSSTRVNFTATVKTALNLSDQNIRVLGILLEDGIEDRQFSGIYNRNDDILGEFGEGGVYGQASFLYTFNNVARGVWGQSHNGTPRLIPGKLEIGKEYNVEVEYTIPSIVEDRDKMKMAVILIDENTGRVINAAVGDAINAVEEIIADASADLNVVKRGSEIVVECSDDFRAEIYTIDGRLLRSVNATGSASVSLDGISGIVVVRAVAGTKSVTRKFAF